MEALVHQEKNSISFSKVITKLFLSLHYNNSISYLCFNAKEIFMFKSDNKNDSVLSRKHISDLVLLNLEKYL